MAEKQQGFPTEVVDLPSKGLLYPEGHVLSGGTIEIKYMTAKEEDILTSQNLIQKGVVLDELLKSLIASKVSLNELMIGDKNAIMVASRIFGYGKEYSVDTACPECGEVEKDCSYDLTTFDHKKINEKYFKNENVFEFELPQSKRKIEFKFMTHKDEADATMEISKMKKSMGGRTKEVTTRLRKQIVSVDGDKSQGHINNFIENEFFAMDSRAYRDHYASHQPDIDFTTVFSCGFCGEVSELELPIATNFFWPSR
jgi:hypothetical protein